MIYNYCTSQAAITPPPPRSWSGMSDCGSPLQELGTSGTNRMQTDAYLSICVLVCVSKLSWRTEERGGGVSGGLANEQVHFPCPPSAIRTEELFFCLASQYQYFWSERRKKTTPGFISPPVALGTHAGRIAGDVAPPSPGLTPTLQSGLGRQAGLETHGGKCPSERNPLAQSSVHTEEGMCSSSWDRDGLESGFWLPAPCFSH